MKVTTEQRILIRAIEKAWASQSFMNRLIEKPMETLDDISNGSFEPPLGYSIEFVHRPDIDIVDINVTQLTEDRPGRVLRINIPQEPDLDSLQLTEDQLEIVSAGSEENIASLLLMYLLLPLLL